MILHNFHFLKLFSFFYRFKYFTLIFLFFQYYINYSQCTSVTLGIDWGEEYVEASISFRGHRPDILLTGTGSRKFENSVYLLGDTRLFDKEASSYALKDPAKTLQKSAHLLGIQFTPNSKWSRISSVKASEVVATLQGKNVPFHWDYTPYEFGVSKDGQLHLKVLKDSMVGLEEATGHFFNHLKHVALEKLLSVKAINSVDAKVEMLTVISIPCNYTQNQRKALVFAAETAGLKVVDLVHGVTAAAWFQTLEMTPGTRKILYYDLGSSGANVAVVESRVPEPKSKGFPQVRTLSCVTYPGIGGRQHDILLAEYLRAKFESENSLKLMPGNPKSLQKLLKSANKAKMKLTLSNSASVEVENLVNNKQLSVKLTREEYDKLLEPVLNQLQNPVDMALEKANLKLSDLDSVEMLGGAWRVPAVTRKLSNAVRPLSLGFHLNAEECIAMGCGYLAAIHNPFFRMKRVDLYDNAVYYYVLHVKGPDLDKRVTLYKPMDKVNSSKIVKVNTSSNFHVLIYETPNPDESDEVKVLDYKITGVEDLLVSQSSEMMAQVTVSFKTQGGVIRLHKVLAKSVKKAQEKRLDTSKYDLLKPKGSAARDKFDSQTDVEKQEDEGVSDSTSEGSDSGYDSEDSESELNVTPVYDPGFQPPQGSETADSGSAEVNGDEQIKSDYLDILNLKNQDFQVDEHTTHDDTVELQSPGPTNDPTTQATGDPTSRPSNEAQPEATKEVTPKATPGTKDRKPSVAAKIAEKAKKEKTKKSEEHVRLDFVDNTVDQYHPKKLEESKNNIQALVNKDKATIERSQLKNRLESTLYKYKGFLKSEDFRAACKPSQEESFGQKVKSFLEWFEENSHTASSETLTNYLEEVNSHALPIVERMNWNLNRESLVNSTDHAFSELQQRLNKLLEEKPFLRDHKASLDLFDNSLTWWDQVKAKQETLPLYEEPLFDHTSVKSKLDVVKLALKNLESIPPPKPPQQPTDTTTTTTSTTTTTPNEKQEL